MGSCGENKNGSKVILMSCSGMCVHGQISAGAVHQVLYERAPGKCDWVCPAAIGARIGWQIDRLKNARAIVAVPGCAASCDVTFLKQAGFKPTKTIAAHKVCDFGPWGIELSDIPADKRQEMINKLADVIEKEIAVVCSE